MRPLGKVFFFFFFFEKWLPQTLDKSMPQSESSRPRSSFGKRKNSGQSTTAFSARKGPAAKSSLTPSKRVKGRNFETISPHSVPQVGGVLGEFGNLLRHRIGQWRSFA